MRVFLVIAGLLASLLVPLSPTAAVAAADSGGFDPGLIVSNQRFFDSNSMTEGQIQAFLEGQVSRCAAGYTCLKDFRQSTFSRAAVEPGHCTAYVGVENELASSIIAKTAKACGINPQTLLVLLQKETSLVTSTHPASGSYRKAAGYGCPDTSSCDSAFYGFYNQVYKAAWQFRQYSNYPNRTYKIGQVPVGYHPNASCGSSTVNIQNQATANLYNYTPYRPNAAAMANLYGTGDSCSSYGNRNFWRIFRDWFGSPTGGVNPIGNIEEQRGVPGGVQFSGWVIDPDAFGSIDVHLYVDGKGVAVRADSERPDVAAGHLGYGSKHGFTYRFPAAPGEHEVCAWGINVGPGSSTMFGCAAVTVPNDLPFGALESVKAGAESITAVGWAIDPNTSASIPVHLYVGAKGVAIPAALDRPDIAVGYPSAGRPHGFKSTVFAPAGTQTVCAYAINTGPGENALIGCRNIYVLSSAVDQGRVPIGNAEEIVGVASGIKVSGWALDPDTVASIDVHVYVDGIGGSYVASDSRPDVAVGYPSYGAERGFSEVIAAAPGVHRVCVYGINTGAGGHTVLACQDATVPGISDKARAPQGNLEQVVADSSGIRVSGWALDADTADSIPVHVYVDGVGVAYRADKARADVAAIFPGYGAAHGFNELVTAAPGSHRVCVYGINTGAGGHTLLDCRIITTG